MHASFHTIILLSFDWPRGTWRRSDDSRWLLETEGKKKNLLESGDMQRLSTHPSTSFFQTLHHFIFIGSSLHVETSCFAHRIIKTVLDISPLIFFMMETHSWVALEALPKMSGHKSHWLIHAVKEKSYVSPLFIISKHPTEIGKRCPHLEAHR